MRRVRFLPVYDDKGVWVTVAGILIVAVVMISMAMWVARELPAVRSEEEFKRTEDLLDALKRLQGNLQVIEPDDVVTFQAAISSSAPSLYAPKLAGTLSTIDAPESAIRVIAHTTRWDFEEGMWRSENGLSENIYVGSDADGYGYITLENSWSGNSFITKTTRTLGIAMNSYDSLFSIRFVAPGTGTVTVQRARLFVYNSGNPDPNNPYKASIYITADDNHGHPNVTPNSTTRNPIGGVDNTIISDTSPFPKGTWGWMPATGLNATLNSGQVYHLVLDMYGVGTPGVGPTDWDYLVVAFTEPLNTDNRSVVSWCRGTTDENPHWNEFNWVEPVFIFDFTSGDYWGNPYHGGFKYYDESTYYPEIDSYGDNRTYISYSNMDNFYSAGVINSVSDSENDSIWGENFYLSVPTTISAIEVPVDRHGLPTSDLYVYIENSTWSESHRLKAEDIRSGDTPPPDERLLTPVRPEGVASGNPGWYRITLDQPRTLAADNYWIYLRTMGDTKNDYYRVPLDNANWPVANMSWGVAENRAFRASMPSGSDNLSSAVNLQLFNYVDMPFRLIFENYKENAMYTSPVIAPGKRVKWLNLTWDNYTPVGTNITVQVRVGDMAHPENPNLPDDPNYPWSEWKTVQNGQDLGEVFGEDLVQGVNNRVANALQYRIRLSTTDNTVAPVVRAVYVRYFEGVGTTRAQLPVEWIQTTDEDFESWRVSGTENVHIGEGAVTLENYIPVYYPQGVFISTFDAGEVVDWKSIEFEKTTPSNTSLSFDVGFSDDNLNWFGWLHDVTSGQSLVDNTRYVQYRATFTTTDSNYSPTLKRVSISYISIYTESLSQTDWSGGSTSPTLESGTWPSDYNRYNRGENVDATLSVGDVSLDYGGDNRSWGNQFIVNTTLASATLDESNEYLSLRFRARRTENIYGMRVYVDNYSFAGLAVQIRRDDPSNPGKPGENLTPEKEVQISSTGWLYIQLSTPAQLVKDNIYHIVLRMVPVENITSSWTQTDWAGGPKSPVDVGNWGEDYNNFFEMNNVDWSTSGTIKLAKTSELPLEYAENGWFTSSVYDSSSNKTHWRVIEWLGLKLPGTDNVVKVRLDNSLSGLLSPSKSWRQVDNGDNLDENARYAQYRVEFTSNKNFSPEIYNITLHYTTRPGESGDFDQTSWQGGDNQAMWSVENKFGASENIDWENIAGSLELLTEGTENYGNPFRVGDNAIIGRLDNDNYLADIRFTAQSTRSITGVRFYVRNAYRPWQFKVRLCQNAPDDVPDLASPLAVNNNVPIFSAGWVLVNLGSVSLDQDNVYHIVINRVPISSENNFVGAEPNPLVDGTQRVGTVVGGSYSNTQAQDVVYESIAEPLVPTATVTYNTMSTIYQPNVRDWLEPGPWGAQENLPSTGSTYPRTRLAYCPLTTRGYEKIVVSLTDKYLDAYVWKSSWSVTYDIGAVSAATTYRSYDIAYETLSGRALLVYGVDSDNAARDIAYKIWDGENWSDPYYLDNPLEENDISYQWISLASSPISNEIALIGLTGPGTSGENVAAWIWNANTNSFPSENFKALENNMISGISSREAIAVAYELGTSHTPHAVFAWRSSSSGSGNSRDNLKSREWTGSWGTEQTIDFTSTGYTYGYWLTLKADPASDNMMLGAFYWLSGSINLGITVKWDGSAWVETKLHTTIAASSTVDRRYADFEWEPSGSNGLLVYAHGTSSYIVRKIYLAATGWATNTTSSSWGSYKFVWVRLARNPVGGTYKILGVALNTNGNIGSFSWKIDNTLALDSITSITNQAPGSPNYYVEPFDLKFKQAYGYTLNWEHRITNIFAGYDNFNVKVYGYADTDENIGVYIRKKSPTDNWEFMDNLPTVVPGFVNKTISGSEIANYLNLTDNSLSIRYFEGAVDFVQTKIYIDYVAVEKTVPMSWAEVGCSRPPNLMRPKDGSQDLNANTLFYNGTSWTIGDNQPIYLLENSTGREGNPYASAESYSIYGTNWAGENFTVSGNKSIAEVRACVKTVGVGAPAGNLRFAIRWSDNNDNVVTGILATSAVYDNYTWLENASIPSTVLLNGVSYRFILSSPNSTSSAYWALCAPSTLSSDSVYTSATYNGTNAVATYSNSGGASGSWTDDNKRDAVYNLRVATYKPSGWLQSSWFDPVGVPVNWGTISFTSGKPLGSEDVRVYVQVSDNENATWRRTGGPYLSDSSINVVGRYCRYCVNFGASPGNVTTPRLDDITVFWFWGAQVSWATLRVSTPVNEYMAYDGLSRDNADVLYSIGGASWSECGYQPIFVLDADTDGNGSVDGYDGNPYAVAGSLQIWGSNYAGERIAMSRSFAGGSHHVLGFQAYVRKVGSPGDNLYYELWDLTNSVMLDSGTFATAGDVSSSWTWVNKPFSKPCLLVTGRDYRLSLSSPGSSSSDCYEWMALSTGIGDPYEQSTYGGTDSVAAYYPSGYNWEYITNRDVLFQFTAARGYPSSGWLESSVFDVGREVSWQTISWSAVTSDNATVGVEARTGVDSNPDSGDWNVWNEVTNGGLLPENRYVQYRIIENTTNDNETPVLQSVTISYPRETPPEAPENSMVRTWVQTTTADFLADRLPDVIGQNVEAVSPGDLTLKATSYWGNQFVSSSGFSMASRLDSEDKLFAIRFVAEEDEKVWNVKLMALVCCDGQIRGPTDPLGGMADVYWDVLLVKDINGVPDMSNVLGRATGAPYKQFPQTPRGSGSTATGDRTSSMEWYLPYPRLGKTNDDMAFSLPGYPADYRPQLTGGQTYHLVVTVNKAYANLINRDNWIAVLSHRRDNIQPDYWINGKTYNTNRAVLFGENRGGSYTWETSTTAGSPVEGRDPMYVLGVERGGTGRVENYEGDPYYQSDEEIYTNNYVGERIPIDNDYGDFSGDGMKIGAIELFMKGVGESIGESYVGIRLGSENLSEMTYSIPLDYSSSYSWARFTLPTSFTVWEGETYNIYIKSPASTQSSYGAVDTMKTPWETNTKAPYVAATYGGPSSLYIWSYNDNLWDNDDCREIPFRFVTGYSQSGNFTSGVFDAGQVVDWQYIEWDETRPPGTDIKLYVLAGGERYGPFLSGSSLEGVPDSRHISYEVEMTTDDPATSPALHEVRIGYRGGFGSLRIELQNQGGGKTLAYEGGAVIVKQNDRSTMYSMPDDMIVITENDNRLKLDVNYRLLMNPLSVKSTALTTMAGVNFYMPEDMRVVKENDNMSSVEITIVSDFAQAWYEYLQSVSDRINRSYPGWSTVTQPSEYEIKLVIKENESRSIDYRETVREIKVQIL